MTAPQDTNPSRDREGATNPSRDRKGADARDYADDEILTVLVTGGGGFIGKAIIHRLLARGYTVRNLSRNRYPELDVLGVTTIQGDLANLDTVERACTNCDAVFHVAAKAGVWGAYDDYHRANVLGTENCLAASQRRARYFIHTSSPSVIFDGHDMTGANESAPYPAHHRSHYSATKARAEKLVLAANRDDFRTVALRPHLVWGPGDNHIVPRILAQARAGKLRIIGSGDNQVDTTYIDNAADAHLCALNALRNKTHQSPGRKPRENPNRDREGADKQSRARKEAEANQSRQPNKTTPERRTTTPPRDPSGKPYFISNGEPIVLWDIINGILAAAGEPPITRHTPRPVALTAAAIMEFTHRLLRRKGEPRLTRFIVEELSSTHHFDITAARRDLGYKPKVTTAEGLASLREYLSNNPT